MTTTGEHEIALAAIAAVIPPCSEVVLPARAKNNLTSGDYMLEDEMNAPCCRLMIARALVDPSKGTFACRLLNPTDTPIKLREDTPLGALVPVTPEVEIESKQANEHEPTGLSGSHRRRADNRYHAHRNSRAKVYRWPTRPYREKN
jgi:hypothetical protein